MYALSAAPGTTAGLQFDAVSKLPVPAIQWMSPPTTVAVESSDVPSDTVVQVASVNAVAVTTILSPTVTPPFGTLMIWFVKIGPAMQPEVPRKDCACGV